jgi:hypothetical protein
MTLRPLLAIVFSALLGQSAHATAVNLISNGSFETGTGTAGAEGSFTGWTIGGTFGSGPGKGPERITYGTNATGYGDAVTPDPFTNSPDASGSHAAFFVDDNASETLSQSISVVTGTEYEVGFDFFETNSGAANPGAFTLSASLNGTLLTTISSGVTYGAGTWYHVFEVFEATSSGTSGFKFAYSSANETSKDVIVDDVYVEVAPESDVPEPASFGLMGLGLGAVAFLANRRNRARA